MSAAESTAWASVRGLREKAILAARIEKLATVLDAPGIVRDAGEYVLELGARLELATKHARRVSGAKEAP